MLELTIRCTCKICNEPLVISSLPTAHDLYNTKDNILTGTPFSAYHHKGFGDEIETATVTCNKCNAEYTIVTDIISVFCSIEDLDDEYENDSTPEFNMRCEGITFTKWLKLQKGRSDNVGNLARDAFFTNGFRKEIKKFYDSMAPSRPKNANSYEAWLSFLDGKKKNLTAFRMAWAEYKHQKQYCRIK